jgi:hypothetical protein
MMMNLYRVSYSSRVLDAIKALILRAREIGTAPQVLAAVREIDRRLQIYPQFGQPLQDLSIDSAQIWIGVVSPLVLHYIIDEERRQVMVLLPPSPFSNSGL